MERPFRPYEGSDAFVFVCYAHDDDEVVYSDLQRLADQGINLWYDEGISPGTEWSDAIAERIRNCSTFLYCVSPRSVASEYCRQELRFAQEVGRPVLSVHLEPTDLPDGLRLQLGHRQAIMRYAQSPATYEERLLEALHEPGTETREPREQPGRSPRRRRGRSGAVAAAGVLVVVVVALVWYLSAGPPSARAAPPSILVLPFENLSPLEENAFFAAGLHEDLLTRLSQIEALTVISRTSSIALASSGKTIPEMAAQLNLTHVLEGSVRRDAGRVKVTVQLIEAPSDRHFWAEAYDRQLTHIFDLQRDLADAIARQLELRLDSELLARFADAPTDNLEAYDLVLRGRQSFGKSPANAEAIALFEQAVELDPSYAEAWARLGRRQAIQAVVTRRFSDIPEVAIPNLRHALSLDPDSPTALAMLAQTLMSPRYPKSATPFENAERMREAQHYLERALARAPNDAEVHAAYGGYLEGDDLELRLRHLEEAVRLDPLGPPIAHWNIVEVLDRLGRSDEALAHAEDWRKLQPANPVIDRSIARVYMNRGEILEFLKHMHAAALAAGPASVAGGNGFAEVLRRYEELDAALRWVDWLEPGDPIPVPVLVVRWRTLWMAGRWRSIVELAQQIEVASRENASEPVSRALMAAEAAFFRAQEARRAARSDEYRLYLEAALEGFRQFDDTLGLGQDFPNRQCDLYPAIQYMVAARQSELRALADDLLARTNECVAANYPSTPPARANVGSRRWTYHLDRALWLALNGRIDEALDAFEAEYCCALSADLTALGVLEDLGGTFHGIARQPRFQRRLEARNREIEELHRRIRGEAPWILTPPS